MAPVEIEAFNTVKDQEISLKDDSWRQAYESGVVPYRKFLLNHHRA